VKNVALVLAILCFVIAILYVTGILQFMADPSHHYHISHFVLFVVLGILCLIWMRFASKSAAA